MCDIVGNHVVCAGSGLRPRWWWARWRRRARRRWTRRRRPRRWVSRRGARSVAITVARRMGGYHGGGGAYRGGMYAGGRGGMPAYRGGAASAYRGGTAGTYRGERGGDEPRHDRRGVARSGRRWRGGVLPAERAAELLPGTPFNRCYGRSVHRGFRGAWLYGNRQFVRRSAWRQLWRHRTNCWFQPQC